MKIGSAYDDDAAPRIIIYDRARARARAETGTDTLVL